MFLGVYLHFTESVSAYFLVLMPNKTASCSLGDGFVVVRP